MYLGNGTEAESTPKSVSPPRLIRLLAMIRRLGNLFWLLAVAFFAAGVNDDWNDGYFVALICAAFGYALTRLPWKRPEQTEVE